MNYKLIYDTIIERRRETPLAAGYSENHHILPKSLGGTAAKENMVRLTAKEHFVCHRLLVKIYQSDPVTFHKMVHAFMMMLRVVSDNQQRFISSASYAQLKLAFVEARKIGSSGEKNSNYGNQWICNTETGEVLRLKTTTPIPQGWVKGMRLNTKCEVCGSDTGSHQRKLCDLHRRERKVEMGKVLIKRIMNSATTSYKNKIFITNGTTDKTWPCDQSIPDDWRRGRTQNKHLRSIMAVHRPD
jgi:hypothetical protein